MPTRLLGAPLWVREERPSHGAKMPRRVWHRRRPTLPSYHPSRRFWGNQLRHFTQPNDTGSTRVSFDLRCMPLSLFVHDWKVSGK